MNENEDTRPLPEADPTTTPNPSGPGPTSPASGSTRRRTALIGSAVVVVLLAGGGVAYALSSDSDDTAVTVSETSSIADDVDPDDVDDGSAHQEKATTSVAALRDAARAAVAATGADGATSVDVERNGFDVEVRLPDGREQDVHVRADGGVAKEPLDSTDDPGDVLDLDRFDAVAAAATAAVGRGSVESISSSDDRGVRYEVGVRLADGRDADVELADDLRVVSSDMDD
ncbi:hypothetical protein [Gordonia malaquae]|uniref:hypothetical protein n=1 Tax=Gordonia malaquae TaxID=410332 RepID=UPI003016DF0B